MGHEGLLLLGSPSLCVSIFSKGTGNRQGQANILKSRRLSRLRLEVEAALQILWERPRRHFLCCNTLHLDYQPNKHTGL
jgi:hypothetical protein